MIRTRASTLAHASNLSEVAFIEEKIFPKVSNEAMTIGKIWHSLILEKKYPDNIVRVDFENYRTKAAQQERDNAIFDGKIPMLMKELEIFAEADLKPVQALFDGYETEVAKAINFQKKAIVTGHIDACNGQHVKDLKCVNATVFKNPLKEIFTRGYDIQLFLYMLMSQTQTASIIFFNAETGIFQEVDMHINDIKDSCLERLEKSFKNLEAWENYQKGMRELNPLQYFSIC